MKILLIIILACALWSCKGVQDEAGNTCNFNELLESINQLKQRLNNNKNKFNAAAEELNNKLCALKTTLTGSQANASTTAEQTTVAPNTQTTNSQTTTDSVITVENCDMVASEGNTQGGIYNIKVNEKEIEVYCEIANSNQGWLVFQRRTSNATDFYRNWTEYRNGFGNKNDNFWLGLENLHMITTSQSYQLRIDLEDFEGNTAYALYSSFSVGDESSNYRLTVGRYSGNAGDSMDYPNNRPFTTFDRDNDGSGAYNCAVFHQGAWWYGNCGSSSLNGEYFTGGQDNWKGIWWIIWKGNFYSMKFAQMKIRPN